jgi:hypothetical protein
MRPALKVFCGLLLVVLWNLDPGPVLGQLDYGTRLGSGQGADLGFAPQGPGVMLGALDPAVRRWYVPQELFKEYQWRQWEYANYARDPYQRYVSTSLEGDYFYDIYGNFLTRGWLIFNNSQVRPQQFGNSLFKSTRFDQWFSGVVIAADHKNQYHYTMTLSNQLRTTLTPMVLSKPRMDAVQFDLATDRYEATLLYSRISSPGGVDTANDELLRTNNTTLVGGRLVFQVGDFVKVGAHAVNAHQSNTLSDKMVWNPFSGGLTVDQNRPISRIQLVLRDDSPADGKGGAAFFSAGSDIIITYQDGTVEKGKEIRFGPVVEGGFVQQGFIAADGTEEIRLLYDFDSPAFLDRASFSKSEIIKVEFQLQMGNDYQIWMTSDRQTDNDGQPVLLLVTRAEGNVQDITNLRTVHFEYGLPTATHIAGGSVEVRNLLGFDLYGEYDLSWSFRKYPNALEETHKTSAGISGKESAPAWMVNLSQQAHPWFVFGEVYSMDPFYNTRTFVTSGTGKIDYASERQSVVEFVEDNDDQDRYPDTVRFDWLVGDNTVFPGWDHNNDFIPDFNQNDNFVRINAVPDYEEPFLRFGVDRPEFLFGVDMNHNFWVDQYENDEEPDYPYRKDHEGFNLYGGAHITPRIKLVVGVLREELISADKKNHSNYALLSLEEDLAGFGRVRFFEMAQWVKDDIPNPLLQWSPDNSLQGGELAKVEDPLLARDTWVNQVFLGHTLQASSLFAMTKVNYALFRQLMSASRRQELELDATDFFFGAINKVSYRYPLGSFILEPRWKSEYTKQTRTLFVLDERTTLSELVAGLVETKILQATRVQFGLEYLFFNDFDGDVRDFNSLTLALQFTNESSYLGYRLRALVGTALERKDFKEQKSRTTNQSFITIYAGLD